MLTAAQIKKIQNKVGKQVNQKIAKREEESKRNRERNLNE